MDSWMFLIWDLNPNFVLKPFLHVSHWNKSISVASWIYFSWFLQASYDEKYLRQYLQAKFFSTVKVEVYFWVLVVDSFELLFLLWHFSKEIFFVKTSNCSRSWRDSKEHFPFNNISNNSWTMEKSYSGSSITFSSSFSMFLQNLFDKSRRRFSHWID